MQLSAGKSGPLRGCVRVPGDKSISHRALILGALATGETRISGLLEADDVLHTAAALRALGVDVEREKSAWRIIGRPWQTPSRTLYAGNAGTGVRLLMGAVAGQNVGARFDGDKSLRARPMKRILAPLEAMGLVANAENDRLPVKLHASLLHAITYRLPVPSAQVKSAVLFAGLGAVGTTVVEEPVLCRDHTERMLIAFGAKLEILPLSGPGRRITLEGGQQLKSTYLIVPGDPSSAAFLVVAGLIVPGSDLTIEGVLMNPGRVGLYETLREMGGDITCINEREEGGETVADIRVRHSQLTGVDVPADRAASMIDEYPVLAIAAATARGVTRMSGLEELRVKESDRLAALSDGLAENGIAHETGPDWLSVTGGPVVNGGLVQTKSDHRIAMSFLILGLVSEKKVTIDSGAMIATSFPGFAGLMTSLGAAIQTVAS